MKIATRHIRIVTQGLVFALWAALLYATYHPMDRWIAKHLPVSLFLRADPLVMTVVNGGMRLFVSITSIGLVTLVVSFLLGRVFCGWVCPLGTLFDAYGWVLKKFRVPFEGPSPKWFRLKYYILLALMLFALMGAVSPLMGLDPIVLLTRFVASFIMPLARHSDQLTWSVGAEPGKYGAFIDILTLLLVGGIFFGTTKLSRIWCRTTCPLGGYLGIVSRFSVLKRETEGCVRCNICANHCPTGAIDFRNPELYNESECIKCFSCSQECPVDANFFTLRSPLPVQTPAHTVVALERRELLATSAFTILAAPVLHLASGEPNSHKTLLRPPMSREEHDFLSSCIRCDECVKACPTGILKPAKFEHGLRALWSPVMVPTEGLCQEGCNACSQACPTDAILKYKVENKYRYKAGTAVFESSRCISVTDGKFCLECVKACPTDAISVDKGWQPAQSSDEVAPLGMKPSLPSRVHFDLCVGCGACENVCNKIVLGEPAMVTTSFGRAVPTQGVLDQG